MFRTYLQVKNERDGGDPDQLSIGPSLQFYLKPLLRLSNVTLFDLDDAKSRPMVLETGYRFIAQPNTAAENRLVEAVTFHFPIHGRILMSDRNRADLDWKDGKFTWRYRNKLTIERSFTIRGYHPSPYVAAEPYYESQYKKWSTTALYAGCLLPAWKNAEFSPYYEHENNTGKAPNKQDNIFGIALYMYFAAKKH